MLENGIRQYLGDDDIYHPEDDVVEDLVDDPVDDIMVEEDTDDNKDIDIDMKAVLEELKNGNALIVINGKEYPELHSTKEAAEYMKAHNIWFNNMSWMVGDVIKEKYPNTDKKVVIEYFQKEKKEQK